jgi:hypothetical protein
VALQRRRMTDGEAISTTRPARTTSPTISPIQHLVRLTNQPADPHHRHQRQSLLALHLYPHRRADAARRIRCQTGITVTVHSLPDRTRNYGDSALISARLNELRENWLNPADLVRREPEVVPGYPDRILPVSITVTVHKFTDRN